MVRWRNHWFQNWSKRVQDEPTGSSYTRKQENAPRMMELHQKDKRSGLKALSLPHREQFKQQNDSIG